MALLFKSLVNTYIVKDNIVSIFKKAELLQTEEVEEILLELVTAIAITLQVDRCFLYVRDPQTRLGQATFCYCKNPQVLDVSSHQWKKERSENLEAIDPMFAAALNCQPSIYVEDVEIANPVIVNRDFEAREFGHRALIHAHLCQDGKLWGILQPCVFNRSRKWTTEDRQIIEMVVSKAVPYVKKYVLTNRPQINKPL